MSHGVIFEQLLVDYTLQRDAIGGGANRAGNIRPEHGDKQPRVCFRDFYIWVLGSEISLAIGFFL